MWLGKFLDLEEDIKALGPKIQKSLFQGIKKYKINSKDKSLDVSIENLTECKAIKPRFTCKIDQIEKYRRRYLPARNLGTMIISTSKGLVTQEEAQKENLGGCLIAYFY